MTFFFKCTTISQIHYHEVETVYCNFKTKLLFSRKHIVAVVFSIKMISIDPWGLALSGGVALLKDLYHPECLCVLRC